MELPHSGFSWLRKEHQCERNDNVNSASDEPSPIQTSWWIIGTLVKISTR